MSALIAVEDHKGAFTFALLVKESPNCSESVLDDLTVMARTSNEAAENLDKITGGQATLTVVDFAELMEVAQASRVEYVYHIGMHNRWWVSHVQDGRVLESGEAKNFVNRRKAAGSVSVWLKSCQPLSEAASL